MTLKESAIRNLRDIKSILDSLKIVYWLDGGTLLGAFRDRDFPPGDEDDIDIGINGNYRFLKSEIREMAEKEGFKLYHEWEYQTALTRGGSKIDLFFHQKQDRDDWHCIYKQNVCIPAIVPSHFFEELQMIEFHGMTFNCPRNLDGYLTYKYGDWKTPVHRSEYSCYNAENNKVLRPDYKIKELEK